MSTVTAYDKVFAEYLKSKKAIIDIKEALKNREWEDKKYSQYIEGHPYGYWEVCVRCTTYFAMHEDICACRACVNESMIPQNGCRFEPVDECARQWFIDKGYRKCIAYEPRYKWWRNKYINGKSE